MGACLFILCIHLCFSTCLRSFPQLKPLNKTHTLTHLFNQARSLLKQPDPLHSRSLVVRFAELVLTNPSGVWGPFLSTLRGVFSTWHWSKKLIILLCRAVENRSLSLPSQLVGPEKYIVFTPWDWVPLINNLSSRWSSWVREKHDSFMSKRLDKARVVLC